MTEGDLVKINVINSEESKQTHSLHMHGIHAAEMDGVSVPLSSNLRGSLHDVADINYSNSVTSGDDVYESGMILPGKSFTNEFVAHVNPIADHINRGLYGMMIIDPRQPREKMTEMVMTMNGYDMDYDSEGTVAPPSMAEIRGEEEREEEEERDNEIYTVNGKDLTIWIIQFH